MNEIYTERAMRLVRQYILSKLEKTDPKPTFGVYVVWFAYTLGNWKALISTTLPDGMYYEVTHNAVKQETYLDAYKKFDNVCYSDWEDKSDQELAYRNASVEEAATKPGWPRNGPFDNLNPAGPDRFA